MSPGVRIELLLLAFGLLLVLVGGWLSDQLGLCLLVLLIVYLGWHLRSGWLFSRWVKSGMKQTTSGLHGIWRELGLVLQKRRQQEKKAVQRMRDTVKRTSQLTHAIEEGIVVLQRDFSLSWWNVAAKEQLGLQDSDKGHSLASLYRDPALADYLEQKKIKGRLELPSRLNPDKWLMFTASRFGDGDIALVISDISPLKNTERLRREFVGNVSHELRTPITVLRGYLETITDGMIPENPLFQKACEQMSEQVMRMQALADDLIILSKLESQPEKINKKKVRLLPLVQALIEEAQVLSEERHSFSLNCPDNLSLMAQESDIHSAIENLIINAVHHNPAGANIQINISSDGNTIKISVKDNGVGISAEAIPRLTERFYRTDASRSSKVGGSGLGLAIVKHVINRYKGSLEIISRLQEGSEFICTFPVSD